jgi:hypothetical protein
MRLTKLASKCLVLLALVYPLQGADDIFQDTYIVASGNKVEFGGTFVDRPDPSQYTVTLLHDQGFITTYDWDDKKKKSQVSIGFGSITEVSNRDKKQNKSKIFQSGTWGKTVMKYQKDSSSYNVKSRLALSRCNLDFASNFTDSLTVSEGNVQPPGYFKYSITISNYNYVYSQSTVQLNFFVSTKEKGVFDKSNNLVAFGNNNETVFHWVPFVTADGQILPVETSYHTNVACAAAGFTSCKGSVDVLSYEIATNAKVINWDPDTTPISKVVTDYKSTLTDKSTTK